MQVMEEVCSQGCLQKCVCKGRNSGWSWPGFYGDVLKIQELALKNAVIIAELFGYAEQTRCREAEVIVVSSFLHTNIIAT